ncbi:MAG: LamG domain-containing protein, partial [Planctomycetota bacterium]
LDYTENVCPGTTLSWTTGEYCVADHNVYFGTGLSDVDGEAIPYLARYGSNSVTPSLELDTTYYWRVEEVNDACDASPWPGVIWQFTTNDGNAFDLSPADGLRGVTPDVTLDWTPGCLADSHTVYIGTDFSDVENGTGGTDKGSQSPGYDPDLERFTSYYWRVEEVNGANTWPGEVRSFRTGYGGVLMYYKFDGSEGFDVPSPITDDTGKVTFTKYTDTGWVKYSESNPIINAASGTSGNFDPNAGLYRLDPCDPNGWDYLRLDGYQYTIEMWLKPEVLSPAHGDITLIGKRGSWNIQINDPNPGENDTAYRWNHAGNDESMFDDSAVEGEWAHLAAVYNQIDDSGQRMQFYLNGMLQASTGETSLNPADNNMVTIGMEELADGNFTGFFDGLIDELRVLDVALTPCDFLTVPGPEWASCPSPANGEEGVDPCDPSLSLTWTSGIYCVADHNIYFGTSLSYVDENADPCVAHHGSNSWTLPALEFGKTYYWRVDEINDSCGASPWVGVIWQFTTRYEILDPNLLLWYKFDETSGDEVFDSSGHGLHGDGAGIDNEDWEPNNGWDGGCLSFGGDERVDVPLTVLSSVDDEITIAVWLNGGNNSGDNWVFSTGYTYFAEAAVPTGSGDVYWRAGNDTNDVLKWDDATPIGWRGDWHHFAFVKDENAGTMSIYFDGLLVDSNTGTSDTLAYTRNRDFELGEKDGDGYVGKIDDFRIYDYAMSADEVAALFRGGVLCAAWGPGPHNGQVDVAYDVKLIWRLGDYAGSHDVYFGTNWDDINDVNSSNYASYPNVDYNHTDACSYDPGLLDLDQIYYWRVDEVNDTNGHICWGRIWKFTVAEYITIDDMEDYTGSWYGEGDHPLDEGWADYYANGTNALITLQTSSPVLDEQSMEYFYDNAYTHPLGYCSEIQSLELSPTDWASPGVKMLMLWFYGWPDNDVNDTEQMYVGVEDDAGLYAELRYGDNEDEDMNDIKIEDWQTWGMPLTYFSDGNFAAVANDVSLTDVNMLVIGFGERNGSLPGGSGYVYFDDIRLYQPTCLPDKAKPEGDLNNDCKVDFDDVEIMADEWLEGDVNLGEVKEPCDANLVGWWKLDDGGGDTAADSSGKNHHGTLQVIDVNVWWVSGRNDVNSALEFDGGRVRVPDHQDLRPLHQVSASAWIYYFEQQEAARVVVKGADNKECYEIEVSDDDSLVFHVRDGNDPN